MVPISMAGINTFMHIYSATNAVINGGAGILVHFPGGQKATESMAVGKHCSNYRAETEALIQAASIVKASDHDCRQVVFLSDALSVLQAYQNHKLPSLAKALQQVAATRRAVLQWIPAHCGISGNEQADILAKEGARGEKHSNNVSFSDCLFVGWLLNVPATCKGISGTDQLNFTCCHTDIEVTDPNIPFHPVKSILTPGRPVPALTL